MPINLLLILLCAPAFLPPIAIQGCSVRQQRLSCLCSAFERDAVFAAGKHNRRRAHSIALLRKFTIFVCMCTAIVFIVAASTHSAAITLMRN